MRGHGNHVIVHNITDINLEDYHNGDLNLNDARILHYDLNLCEDINLCMIILICMMILICVIILVNRISVNSSGSQLFYVHSRFQN